MPDRLLILLASFFYVGKFPVAPGSLASLAGLFLSLSLRNHVPLYLIVTIVLIVIGFTTAGHIERIVKEKDPSLVVIDEVAGAMIAFFMLPPSVPILITAYFLFRAFDMFKIFPVNKLEELPGGGGIMMDDLLAGVYTFIVMHVALKLTTMF